MKKHHWLLAVLTAVFLASCSGPVALGTVNSRPGPTGTLSVTVPAVAPWLAKVLPGATGSRAFLHAGKAVVQVQEASGPDADHIVWTDIVTPVELTAGTGIRPDLQGEITDIPTGDAYRVVVSIYADAADPTPSVVGIRDNVWVNSKDTDYVNVACLPLVPETRTVDLTVQTSFTLAPTATIGADQEIWYAAKLKAKTGYNVVFTSTSGVTGFTFNSDGYNPTTLNNSTETRYFDNYDDRPVYLGVSGIGTDGTYGFTVTEVVGSKVEGNLVFPEGSKGKRYRLILDGTNGYHWSDDRYVNDSLADSYYMSSVPSGTYTLYCKLEGSTAWGDRNTTDGVAQDGDLVAPVQTLVLDGVNATAATDLNVWNPLANAVTWNSTEFAVEPGAHIVVGVDNDSLGQAIVDLWNQQHPSLAGTVSFTSVGSDTSLEANRNYNGNRSDVTMTISNVFPGHQGELLALDSHLTSVVGPNLKSSWLTFSNAAFGADIKALPVSYDGMVFAWNKTMLDALGYDVTSLDADGLPTAFNTWEKIFALSSSWSQPVYKSKSVNVVYPLSLDEPWSAYSGLTTGGWEIYSEGDATKPGFEKALFLQGLSFLKAAADAKLSREGNGNLTPAGSMGWRWDQFLGNYDGNQQDNELSPFGLVGTWMDLQGAADRNGSEYVLTPMPKWGGVRPTPLTKVKTYVINSKTLFPSAATELLRLLYTKDGIQAMVDHSAYVPVLSDGSALEPTYAPGAYQPQFAKAFANGYIEPVNLKLPSGIPAMDLYYNIGITQDYKDVWDGAITPADAQQRIVDKAAAYLATH